VRRRLALLLPLLLALLFAASLSYGLRQGDARTVFSNAAAFCFT